VVDTAVASVVDGLLDSYVGEVFSSLSRKDRVATAGVYARGLMLRGERKSMQQMAQRLGVDHQRLQQFVTSSPWPVEPVRMVLSRKACELIGPDAWVVDDTGFGKDGNFSPCVARQYSGTLGKVGNCQIAVSVHAASDTASCPLNWRLFLPQSWDETYAQDDADAASVIAARRAKSAIPAGERHRPKWEMAVEMIDELLEWGRPRPGVVVADAGYGEGAQFRAALTDRNLPYVMAVKATTSVFPADAVPETPPRIGPGPPFTARYRVPKSSCKAMVLAAGEQALQQVSWRRGTKTTPENPDALMSSRFVAIRSRPAGHRVPRAPDGTVEQVWLLAEWPTGATEPTDYWLSTLPADTPHEELVRLAKLRWRIEHDYRELKVALGLDHFEGRSWLGWHHHATLVTAAHLFLTTLRLTDPKADGQA
jgi:SRSO17 transposase